MWKPASLRMVSIANVVVDAQPGAFHEPHPLVWIPVAFKALPALRTLPAAIYYAADAARLTPLGSRSLSRSQAGTKRALST